MLVAREVALAPAAQLAVEPVQAAVHREHEAGLVAPGLLEVLAVDRPDDPAAQLGGAAEHAGLAGRERRRAGAAPRVRRREHVEHGLTAARPRGRGAGARSSPAPGASHSARVGSRSTAARLRPHAAQNTPSPGGSPQKGQTRVVGCIGLMLSRCATPAAGDERFRDARSRG